VSDAALELDLDLAQRPIADRSVQRVSQDDAFVDHHLPLYVPLLAERHGRMCGDASVVGLETVRTLFGGPDHVLGLIPEGFGY
jgi:hypothetical protein